MNGTEKHRNSIDLHDSYSKDESEESEEMIENKVHKRIKENNSNRDSMKINISLANPDTVIKEILTEK